MSFIERLRFLMDERNVTAYRLTKDIGISSSLLSMWAKNPDTKPTVTIVAKISDYFQVSMDWLIKGEGDINAQLQAHPQTREDGTINKFGEEDSDIIISEIVERIVAVLAEHKMTAKELCFQLGISQSAISEWKKGKIKPSVVTLISISLIFDLSFDWLFLGEGEKYRLASKTNAATDCECLGRQLTVDELTILSHYNEITNGGKVELQKIASRMAASINNKDRKSSLAVGDISAEKTPPERKMATHDEIREKSRLAVNETQKPYIMEEKPTRQVLVLEYPASAGYGNYLSDDDHGEMLTFDEDIIPRGTDYGVRISGDSMEPDIKDGSIVWVESTPLIEIGEIGLFVYDGEFLCKKLEVDRKGKCIKLVSLNKKYPPLKIQGPECEDLRTIGRVLRQRI